MNKIRLIYIIIFFLITGLAFSEPINSGDDSPDDDGRVEGKIFDSGTSIPVEYANVIIYNPADSSMISGGLSDAEGNFKIKDIPFGEYYMTIDFIGYEKQVINNLDISEENRHVDLGTVQLSITALELTAVEVTAEKMAVEYKVDRKVINVDQDLDAAGSSAVEILEKAPSIRVDISGEVSLRGSSNFTVLIDGKPSVLQGSEALQQIPANTIENIEIITNPSVKYDPDGTAGIINIKMKKNRLEGLAGVVNATVGSGDKYATDAFLNYKTGKLSIFGGFEWNDRQFPSERNQQRETYIDDSTFYRNSFGNGAWLRNGYKLKGGVDFTPDDKTSYSFGGEYGKFGFGRDNYQHISEFSDPVSDIRYYISDDKRRWERDYFSLNGSYKRDFEGEGHSLSLFGFYNKRNGSEAQDKTEFNTDENWNSIDPFPFKLRSGESGPSHQFRFESDYSRPLGQSGKIDVGYHYRFGIEDEGAFLETWDYDKLEWVNDTNYTKQTEFVRHIHAVYGIYANSYKTLEYQLGLRGEYTYRDITVVNTGESSLVDRLDYFPSVHVANRFNDKNQVFASYSKRINRPRGYWLEPYETYIDETTRRLGNPALLPEYTNSFEVGYLRTLPAGNISLDVYYRKTDNKITNVSYVDPETGILYFQNQNLNNDRATGLEGSFIYDISKWFNLNLSGSFFNYSLEDRTIESGGTKTSNNWDMRMVAGFKLPTSTRIQLNFAYNSPTVTSQGDRQESYYTDITIRQDFLKKQLNLTFKVGDIFATRKQITTTQGENFYLYNYQVGESRVMSLTLSYRLNNFKQNPKRGSGDMGGSM